MNCKWEDIPGTTDLRGWRKVRCVRYGCHFREGTPGTTPHEHKEIHFECTGIPFAHEWGHWVALILDSIGITKRAYVWFRWRMGIRPRWGCDKREAVLNAAGEYFEHELGSRLFWPAIP